MSWALNGFLVELNRFESEKEIISQKDMWQLLLHFITLWIYSATIRLWECVAINFGQNPISQRIIIIRIFRQLLNIGNHKISASPFIFNLIIVIVYFDDRKNDLVSIDEVGCTVLQNHIFALTFHNHYERKTDSYSLHIWFLSGNTFTWILL